MIYPVVAGQALSQSKNRVVQGFPKCRSIRAIKTKNKLWSLKLEGGLIIGVVFMNTTLLFPPALSFHGSTFLDGREGVSDIRRLVSREGRQSVERRPCVLTFIRFQCTQTSFQQGRIIYRTYVHASVVRLPGKADSLQNGGHAIVFSFIRFQCTQTNFYQGRIIQGRQIVCRTAAMRSSSLLFVFSVRRLASSKGG